MYRIVDPNLDIMEFGVSLTATSVLQERNKDMLVLDTSDMSLERMSFDKVFRVYMSYPNLCDFKYNKEKNGFDVKYVFTDSVTVGGVVHKFMIIQNLLFDVSSIGKFRMFKPVTDYRICYQYKYKDYIITRGIIATNGSNFGTPFDIFYYPNGKIYGWRTNYLNTLSASNRLSFSFSTPDRFKQPKKGIGEYGRRSTPKADYSVN